MVLEVDLVTEVDMCIVLLVLCNTILIGGADKKVYLDTKGISAMYSMPCNNC